MLSTVIFRGDCQEMIDLRTVGRIPFKHDFRVARVASAVARYSGEAAPNKVTTGNTIFSILLCQFGIVACMECNLSCGPQQNCEGTSSGRVRVGAFGARRERIRGEIASRVHGIALKDSHAVITHWLGLCNTPVQAKLGYGNLGSFAATSGVATSGHDASVRS